MNKQLTMSNLHLLDNGKAVAAINHALRQCSLDVLDRPGEKAVRKVVIEIEQTPKLDTVTAALDTVQTRFRIKTTLPIRQTVHYPMLVNEDGVLGFSPNSPQDPRQGDLFVAPEAQEGEHVNKETGEVTDDEDENTQEI